MKPTTTPQSGRSTAVQVTGTVTGSNGDPQLAQRAAKSSGKSQSLSQTPPPSAAPADAEKDTDMENLSKKSQWIVLALASGGCAAFNGVFAKLTTTELTTNFATGIANLIGLSSVEGGVEVVVRAIFFGLNLIFNGIMWTLFTKALARGTSTTQVSILNTSANFMLTAVLGWMIFSESLPPLWFVGAALLVAGNVIIGQRDEGEGKDIERADGILGVAGVGGAEEDSLLGGEELVSDTDVEGDIEDKSGQERDEDILDLGLDEEDEVVVVKSGDREGSA